MVYVKPALAQRSSWAEHAVARFMPAEIADDPLRSKQAQMFITSHLLGPILGNSVPLALWAFDPTPGWDILVLAASITSFWAFPFLLRWGVPFSVLVVLSIAVDELVILWSCYFHGGAASPTLIWTLIVPILAIFYCGGERTLLPYLAAVSALSCLVFVVVYTAFDPLPNDIPPEALLGLGTISTLAVLCYIAMMAIYYARIFDTSVELEEEVRRRRTMTTELREAVVAAERASAAKSQFLARMSHELRSPLNAILGYGQLLQEDMEKEDPLIRDIDRILDAGHYLVRLVSMILDLSKIEAGGMRFDRRPYGLQALMLETVEQHRTAIEASGNRIELKLAPELGTAEVDARRLTELLDGILLNASQYTCDGVVEVVCRRNEAEGTFCVEVRDTGAGMPSEVLKSVFQTFGAPHEAAGSRYGGTGLNLAVGARLCAAMGGKITARSVLGEGSIFTITLPLAAPPEADQVVAPPAGTAPAPVRWSPICGQLCGITTLG